MTRMPQRFVVLSSLLSGVLLAAAQEPGFARPRPLLVLGGTLIDGTGAPARPNEGLLVVDGKIRTLGPDAAKSAPKNTRTVDAQGRLIIPGLIDGHVHFFQTGGLDARPDVVPLQDGRKYTDVVEAIRRRPAPYFQAYLCSGITSVVDPGGAMWGFELREQSREDNNTPRIAFSGPLLATYDPPALELQNDDPIWLMKDLADVDVKLARLAARRPDFVKIWFVHRQGDDLTAQSALVRHAVAAIHRARLRAAVHATTLETAQIAVDAGADILVHSVGDRDVDERFVEAVVKRQVLYLPTLIVGKSYREVRMRQVEFEPFESACAPRATIESFDVLPTLPESVLPRPTSPPPDQLPVQQRNLKRLSDAGAIIVAGTDAGNTRTLHGPSLHREFVLMAEAGLTPAQILVSATSHGARLMGREGELGRIAPGYLADLVVLDRDPLADIRNTRSVRTVIRGGALFDR